MVALHQLRRFDSCNRLKVRNDRMGLSMYTARGVTNPTPATGT